MIKKITKPTTNKNKTKKITKPIVKTKLVETTKVRSMKKRQPNPAFMKPLTPSSILAAVVGNDALPRTEMTKRLWNYIKRNNLQDQNERRFINADDKLQAVFGGRNRVSMFEMTKLVSKHLS